MHKWSGLDLEQLPGEVGLPDIASRPIRHLRTGGSRQNAGVPGGLRYSTRFMLPTGPKEHKQPSMGNPPLRSTKAFLRKQALTSGQLVRSEKVVATRHYGPAMR